MRRRFFSSALLKQTPSTHLLDPIILNLLCFNKHLFESLMLGWKFRKGRSAVHWCGPLTYNSNCTQRAPKICCNHKWICKFSQQRHDLKLAYNLVSVYVHLCVWAHACVSVHQCVCLCVLACVYHCACVCACVHVCWFLILCVLLLISFKICFSSLLASAQTSRVYDMAWVNSFFFIHFPNTHPHPHLALANKFLRIWQGSQMYKNLYLQRD